MRITFRYPQVLSAAKLIRLAQTYSEEQGRDQARINDALEERLVSLEQQVDVVSEAGNDSGALGPHPNRGGGCTERSTRGPGVLASSGFCGINTAGLSEWMTGVDKQLEGLQKLVSAKFEAEDICEKTCIGTDSKQQAATEPAADDSSEAAVMAAQKAAQDECAKLEDRLRQLEAALEANTNNGGVTRSSSLNTKDSSTKVAERNRRPLPSPNQAPTQPPSPQRPPSPPPPSHAEAAVNDDVYNDAGPNKHAVLDAVQEGTAVARKASELAQEALKVGKEAAEQSERTGERLDSRMLMGPRERLDSRTRMGSRETCSLQIPCIRSL